HQTGTHTQSYTHTQAHSQTHTHLQTHTHTFSHTLSHTLSHTHSHTHSQTHTPTYTRAVAVWIFSYRSKKTTTYPCGPAPIIHIYALLQLTPATQVSMATA